MSNNNIISNNLGIVGSGNQAKKIIKVINSKKQKIDIFNYRKENIDNFKKKKIIFIASSTNTHNEYLKKLKNFKNYIFLEKPGASNLKELKYIEKNFKKRLYINYNFIFSKLFKVIKKEMNTKKYGKLLRLDIIQCNGLAFKKNYENWRFDNKKCSGIEEINTVHFINFVLNLFKKVKLISKIKLNISKRNIDNAEYKFLANNQTIINIFNSYTSPYIIEMKLIFENAILNYDGNYLKYFYPRDTFDKKNRFKQPKLRKKLKINFSQDWIYSNKNSIKFFLEQVKKKINKFKISNAIKTLKFVFS